MRITVALGSIALASAAVIASACAGFSSEETLSPPEDSSANTDGFANESDSAGSADSGMDGMAETWSDASLLRLATQGSVIVLRPAPWTPEEARDAGIAEFVYSENPSFAGKGHLYFGRQHDDGGLPFSSNDAEVKGDAPTLLKVDGLPFVAFGAEGTVYGAIVLGNDGTLSPPFTLQDGGPLFDLGPEAGLLRDPYFVSEDVLFFAIDGTLYRGSKSNRSASPLNIEFRAGVKKLEKGQQWSPIASSDEGKLYFSDGPATERLIWVATAATDSATHFVDAHPLFAKGGVAEFPTGLSRDGKTLYFTRQTVAWVPNEAGVAEAGTDGGASGAFVTLSGTYTSTHP